MVLNQFCQLSMELIKNYYELSILENNPPTPSAKWSTCSSFFKVEGVGGVCGKFSKSQAHQSNQ